MRVKYYTARKFQWPRIGHERRDTRLGEIRAFTMPDFKFQWPRIGHERRDAVLAALAVVAVLALVPSFNGHASAMSVAT